MHWHFKYQIMFSSKDFEKCWFLYQSEGLPYNLSIEEFCLKQGVPVNEFNKWYRDTHKRIHPIQVEGAPASETKEHSSEGQTVINLCSLSIGKMGDTILTTISQSVIYDHWQLNGRTHYSLAIMSRLRCLPCIIPSSLLVRWWDCQYWNILRTSLQPLLLDEQITKICCLWHLVFARQLKKQ